MFAQLTFAARNRARLPVIGRLLGLAGALLLSACVYDSASNGNLQSNSLQVSVSGAGSVVSTPTGIVCGADCAELFATDTDVTLTAVATAGYRFGGWSSDQGDCSGTSDCVISMKKARKIKATFDPLPAKATLTVTKVGSGTVTSSTGGISCGTDCSESVNVGDQVTLTAVADSGYTLTGWSGSGVTCSGATCNVTVDGAKTVTATFTAQAATQYALSAAVVGSGTVTSSPAGINCATTCSSNYNSGTSVTLTAVANSGYTFSSWSVSGASCGTANTCTVSMTQARSVTATFTQNAPTVYSLTVKKLGSGTVQSSPAGITCGTSCTNTFNAGSTVTLTATPNSGYTFSGWSGSGINCPGTGTCPISMASANTVTATFTAIPAAVNYTLTVTKSGTGSGTITSSPSGVSCGSSCSGSFADSTSVTLSAAAGSGSSFSGWSGACSGTSTTCTVSMTQARSVSATFTVTSTGGSGTSSGTPDWTRSETPANWDYTAETASRSACAANEGVIYEVGPGKTYTRPRDVPWLKLMPCDQVLFYYSATPYTDIVFIGSRGEKNKWITLAGVPGSNGELPIFDGNNAIMPTNTGANQWSDSSGMIEVVVPSGVVDKSSSYKPGYIHISGLKFQNVRPPAKVTNLSGSTVAWNEFSSGVYIAGAEHVVVDYCEFADNGLGIFANSGGGEYQQTRWLTISHNYFHGNGIAGKASEHNAYTEGIGTVYEYNYFAAPITGTGGDNIKERSAGVIFRYNYIEDGSNLISLRDPESNADFEALAVDVQGQPLVSKAFIYSNIFVARNATVYGEAPTIISHGDGVMGTGKQVRYGQLFFYGNRVISTLDYTAYHVTATPLFDLVNSRLPTTVVARNNLFYATNHTASGTVAPFALFFWQGPADWQSNWINKYQNVYASKADGVLAVGTMFDGSGLNGLTAQSGDPGFVNFSASNFLTTASSPFASLNAALPSEVTSRGLSPAASPVITPFGK